MKATSSGPITLDVHLIACQVQEPQSGEVRTAQRAVLMPTT